MRSALTVLAVVLVSALAPAPALAANCVKSSVGLTALPDLVGKSYQGTSGGLYPDGTNEPPTTYATAGIAAARTVVPRDTRGAPANDGRIALLSVGMSNTTMEFSTFLPLAQSDPRRDPHVVAVDGAQGGQDARAWADGGSSVWSVVEQRLAAAKVTDAQVQVIWLKQAQAGPTTDFAGYTASLASQLRTIIENAAKRFPNLKQVFLSPRTYAGYATTNLNPEPYAYWSGFADKLVVADSVSRPDASPWVGWGPYLWTDGERGRADRLTWACTDARENDGTHPSDSGRAKVAQQLQLFFDTSQFTAWYRPDSPPATALAGGDATNAQALSSAPPAANAPAEQTGGPTLPITLLVVAGALGVLVLATLALRVVRAR